MPAARSRPTLIAIALVAVAAVALAAAGVAVLWPRPAGERGPVVPAGTLGFGDLMVVGALETGPQLAALRADCATSGRLLPVELARAPAGAAKAAATSALQGYLTVCRRYVADIVEARAEQDAEATVEQSYRFVGSMRASDGQVYHCVKDGYGAGAPDPGSDDTPLSCWTAERSRWPALARVIGLVAAMDDRAARADQAIGCGMPEIADLCAAGITWAQRRAVSLTVFADGLARGDTGVFLWLGTPQSVGVAEEQAVDAARDDYHRLARYHGFADGTPTAHERDRMLAWASTVRAALTSGNGR